MVLAPKLPAALVACACLAFAVPAAAQSTFWPFAQAPSPSDVPHAGAIPADADPAYSTPVDLDGSVDRTHTTRRDVADPTNEPAGTVTINTKLRKLYLSLGDGRAYEYGIGVGRQGFTWKGTAEIGRKAYWPGWTPPPEMLARQKDLPTHLDGSLGNPLGARALYLFEDKKDTLFRIHGTNDPTSIGHAVSSGCIRMNNVDVIDLYGRVAKGTKVVVL
jgi:lipoprotein-anchoring transpeptidase ErfK/SrfK